MTRDNKTCKPSERGGTKIAIATVATVVAIIVGLTTLHGSWILPAVQSQVYSRVQVDIDRVMERREKLVLSLLRSIEDRLDRIEERMNK